MAPGRKTHARAARQRDGIGRHQHGAGRAVFAEEESEEGVRTDQEYRNLEAENASLRERLEKAETDAAFWLDALKEVRKTLEIASVTPNVPINNTIWYSNWKRYSTSWTPP